MFQNYDQKLVKLLIDNLILLEFTDNQLMDEDYAVQIMEGIASELQSMDDESKKRLLSRIDSMIDSYPDTRRDFVKNLPETLGLI